MCLAQCEILVLDEPEFREILMPYLWKVWVEKKKAVAALSYLKYMSNSQVGRGGLVVYYINYIIMHVFRLSVLVSLGSYVNMIHWIQYFRTVKIM